MQKDFAAFYEELTRFEKSNALFGYTIKNRRFWDYIRWSVIEHIANEKYKPKLNFPYHRLSRRKRKAFKEILLELLYAVPQMAKIIINYIKFKNNMFDMVFFDHTNRKTIDKKRVNHVAYPFIKYFNGFYSILTFDPSPPEDNVDGKYPSKVVNTKILHTLAKVFGKFVALSRKDKETIEQLRRLILDTYGVDCDIARAVKDIYLPQLILVKIFKGMLKKIKPKLAVIIYDGKKYFIQAPRDLGIPVLELQHGAITLFDPYYSYPELSRREAETIPDYCFTFGKYWNNKINSPSRRIDVGSPYFEQISKDIKEKRPKRNEKNILAVSTLDYDMAETVSEFAELMPDYTIYYKLRPEEYAGWKELYPQKMTAQENIVFIDNDKKSIYEYLCESAYVISTFSTAILEALFFGTNVIIFKGWHSEMFMDLIDDGYALQAANARDIAEIVANNKKTGRTIDPEYLYKSNSLENMGAQLKGGILCP